MDRPRRSTRQPVKAPQLVTPAAESSTTARPVRAIKRKIPPDADVKTKANGTTNATGTGTGTAPDPEKMFKTLMQSSKSELVSLDMTDIINVNTWSVLSEDSRKHLMTLLPPTAFTDWRERLGEDHPCLENVEKGHEVVEVNGNERMEVREKQEEIEAGETEKEKENAMVIDEDETKQNSSSSSIPNPNPKSEPAPERELNPSFFTDPHFLAAARTFQDHLYLNWFSDSHIQKVKQYQEGIVNGALAAPWKDVVWERDNPSAAPVPEPTRDKGGEASSSIPAPLEPTASATLAGGASEVKLYTLAKNKIIRVGDVIAYRRSFASQDIVVEKDAIIQSIHPKTYAIMLLTHRGTTKDLPPHLLSSSSSSSSPIDVDMDPPSPSSEPSTLPMTITSPTMLETALLDIDARVDKARRPNGNAWKTFSVWRYRAGAEYNPYDSRGGRESHGTLFYLRGSFYHENW